MKPFKSLIIGLIGTLGIISTAGADTVLEFNSIHSPARPGIPYEDGINGLNYVSFNNFTNNPNIGVGGREGNEREFMVVKYCENGECCTDPDDLACYYADTQAHNIKEGDVLRFEIYFHDNGSDPFDDNDDRNSPLAKNVRVGIDLSDISAGSSEPELMIRPKGFIKANNNEYRSVANDPESVYKDSRGNVIREARDDVQTFLESLDLTLAPTDKFHLVMKKVNEDDEEWDIDEDDADDPWHWGFRYTWEGGNMTSNSTTFTHPDTDRGTTVNVTPNVSEDKMWLTFDQLPGCFRYSGFAYFDAIVVAKDEPDEPDTPDGPDKPKPVCEKLYVDHPEDIYENTYSKFKAIAISGDEKFNSKIEYSVEEGHGEFFVTDPNRPPLNPSNIINETKAIILGKLTAHNNNAAISVLDIIGNILSPTISLPSNAPAASNRTLFPTNGNKVWVDPNDTVYFLAGEAGEDVIHVRAELAEAGQCERDFDIVEQNACASLNLTSAPQETLLVGDATHLAVDPVDINGNPLPAGTEIVWTTDTGGTFHNGSESGTKLTTTLADGSVKFMNSTDSGYVQANIPVTDPSYSKACRDRLILTFPAPPLTCRDLEPQIRDAQTSERVRRLENNKIYTIISDVEYSAPHSANINYKINTQYGTFIKRGSPYIPYIHMIAALQSEYRVNKTTIGRIFGEDNLTTEINTSPLSKILLVTYSDIPGNSDVVLSVRAEGFSNPECAKIFGITEVERPDEVGECRSLTINPVHTIFDPSERYTVFNITGDFEDHPGGLQVSTSHGEISKYGEENYSTTIRYSHSEVAASNNVLAVVYKADEDYNGETVTITAVVTNPTNSACEDAVSGSSTPPGEDDLICNNLDIIKPDSPWKIEEDDDRQDFQIKVTTTPPNREDELYYTWQVLNDGEWTSPNSGDLIDSKLGQLSARLEDFDDNTRVEIFASYTKNGPKIDACSDFIRARLEGESEEPTIEKFVYPTNKINDADTEVINIGQFEDTKYVTYMVVFTPGSTKSVEIFESALDRGGNIDGNQRGQLTFKDMVVYTLKEGKTRGKTILETAGYEDDDDPSSRLEEFNDENFDPLTSHNYACDRNETSFCMDGTAEDFASGDALRFNNINDLGEDGKIIIKYQMENNSSITDRSCENLTIADGCGEEFNNEVRFTAYEDNDYEGDEFDDKDRAKVIVICPFVLTREGGDIFFHDVIDTGIDVAQCSRVKGHDGPGITPTPPRDRGVVSTGPGDLPNTAITLDLPSHDVCRYSNLSSNIEGYNDVLKHFSSTICELRADVAERWQEDNINKSIAANITRIARWGENISSMSERLTTSTRGSGVFVRNGDLTIEDGLIITAEGGIPAAQTYIVQNGDLIIKGNITYDSGSLTDRSSKLIPSAAFIVINGDIKIAKNVTRIDGIIMAVDLDKTGKGRIMSLDGSTTTKLVINGSLVGDVYDLFANRRGTGDPTKDEGSVTIHYDERILLNTPPGISELIDVQQAIVPN